MSDSTAGGPPPEEHEPPYNPSASTPDHGAGEPPPSEPRPPAQPPTGPPATPPTQPPTGPPVAPPSQPSQPGPPVAPPYGAPQPPPTSQPYGAPGGGQQPPYPPSGAPHPPPGGGYAAPGQPAHAGGPWFSVGDAIGFGWKRFWANPGPWILAALIFLVINALFSWISGGFDNVTDYRASDLDDLNVVGALGLTFVGVLLSIVGVVLSYLIAAFYSRGALDETQGRRPDVAAFFRISNVGNVLLAAFLVAVMTIVGTILCILPGIAVAIFSAFVYYFALDKEQDAITAIKSSFSLVSKNFGSVFLLLLALLGINIVGFLVCFVGLLVTIPLSYIAVAYAYRRLVGEQPV